MISSALYCEQVRMNEKSVTEGQSVRIFFRASVSFVIYTRVT